MKIVVKRKNILSALAHATRLIDRKSTVPILSNIKISSTEEGFMEISSTDLQIGLVEKITAQVEKPGAVTISAQMAFEIVRKLPEDAKVTFEAKEKEDESSDHVKVSSGASVFRLGTLPVEGYPTISQEDLDLTFSVNPKEFALSLQRCSFAMAQEETRYYLNGVYLDPVKNEEGKICLNLVATDGHRLAKVRVAGIELERNFEGVIIPRKAVMEIVKLLEGESKKLLISLSSTSCMMKIGDSCILTTRLIEGNFPNYKKVIPASNMNTVDVDTDIFSRSVERVALVSTDKFGAVKMTLKENKIILTANSLEYGSARDEIDAKIEGKNLEVGFNARYLLEVLQHVQKKHVIIYLRDAGTAVLFKAPGDLDSDFVIMPMRA